MKILLARTGSVDVYWESKTPGWAGRQDRGAERYPAVGLHQVTAGFDSPALHQEYTSAEDVWQ
jgi:hypothetical protein